MSDDAPSGPGDTPVHGDTPVLGETSVHGETRGRDGQTAAGPRTVAGAAPPVAVPSAAVAAPAVAATTAGTSPGTPAASPPAAAEARGQQKVRFDSANIKSTYCNVCNATSTREEVVINFGVNKTWDQGGQELEVQLEHRVILSPFAAKRLRDLLVRLIGEHEQRYGTLG